MPRSKSDPKLRASYKAKLRKKECLKGSKFPRCSRMSCFVLNGKEIPGLDDDEQHDVQQDDNEQTVSCNRMMMNNTACNRINRK